MFNPFDRSAKTAPSHYPRLPFHAIRSIQLLSSIVVGGIMCYFIWHLTHDHWATPWTFIWLTAASLFSIAALSFTILLHCCIGLNPRVNVLVNAFLTLLWGLSWCLLTWYMSDTLRNMCDVQHWHEDIGVMVCRIYKALFTFTLFGLLSTIAAFALDIYVRRQQTRRGIYRLHDLDAKQGPGAFPRGGPSSATAAAYDNASYGHGGLAEPRESEAWEEPRPSMGPYDSAHVDESGFAQRGGYGLPAAQFEYDTGYHGGHAERAYGRV
ncbi:hypothetical protein KC343_g4809 [Hortaea werneckii]|uniref:MARVEL domain-containing protein n=1 Tax=Hortaea werneckii TaxID=91943 RepID=A0A3M7FNS0_HORWE|nr:hypothetical protein KC323_g8149 [Hortaea werneckii]KAI7232278.1 hypothetical protein KC352_g15225 [Hortaea werneckii]KAI7345416.1 hypothetical protein KC320_g8334 [Hortaea werneckii]KAI7564477.1 hypothetical protein KC317_g7030 [Hortaea werneckii]KAI7619229.1 hypothetical protein KC346_g4680 [Hortaea werneckii]